MSSHESHESHDSTPWIETYWQVLLIAFVVCFVALLVSFAPTL